VTSSVEPVARRAATLVVLALAAFCAACATPPTDPAARADLEAANYPLEPMNRTIFDVNQFLDRWLIKPVAQGYHTVLPQFTQDMIRHFLNNLGEPVIFANDMMQFEWQAANTTAGRFIVNSTFGFGGLFDLAGSTGLERQTGDFGQTLYAWGLPQGPYLVLPILGPSDPEDAIGLGIDGVMDPFGYLARAYGAGNSATIGRIAGSGVDLRARNIDTLDDLQRNAIDFYAEMRSLYRQHRASELRHGRPTDMPNLDTDDKTDKKP
jgi:phospholipid-binding lipoprotein MlaA